jgi:hypothetical protein
MFSNLVANAVRTAIAAATAAVSVSVTITRGQQSVQTKCGLGQSRFSLEQGDQVITDVTAIDLLFPAAAYDFGNGPVEPAEGDEYEVSDGITVLTLEAMPYPPEPAWRFMDRFRSHYRVHTKQIKAEAPA